MKRPVMTLLATLLLASCGGGDAVPVSGLPTGVVHIEAAESTVEVQVSIAETDEARTRGLMGVEELGENAGMVFLHEEPVQSGFWMKDTLIPLSIGFWDESGDLVSILDMTPCEADPCEIYNAGAPWIGALEVNLGFFEENGIETGDTVRLER